MGAHPTCLQGYGTDVVQSLVRAVGHANVRIVDIRQWPSPKGAIDWDIHGHMPPVFEQDHGDARTVEMQLSSEMLPQIDMINELERYPQRFQSL